jgi:hypothetical protein
VENPIQRKFRDSLVKARAEMGMLAEEKSAYARAQAERQKGGERDVNYG